MSRSNLVKKILPMNFCFEENTYAKTTTTITTTENKQKDKLLNVLVY